MTCCVSFPNEKLDMEQYIRKGIKKADKKATR
jgi:hypothetical protein